MNILTKFAALSILALSTAVPVSAAEFTKGQVTKVDDKGKKVTIKHEALANLDMPAMTMVFAVPDEATMKKLSAGKPVEFVAERVKGKLTVTQVK